MLSFKHTHTHIQSITLIAATTAISLLTSLTLSNDIIYEHNFALACFNNEINGIDGCIAVSEGSIEIALDLSQTNLDLIGGLSCLGNGGMSYHFHEYWNDASLTEGIGSTQCGATYTGGHYDPWLACGPATGNPYCLSKGNTYSCVVGSSALIDGSGNYDCNENTFIENPYSCEVGDLSGKYGKIVFDDNLQYYNNMDAYSPYEVDANDLIGKSIVFHCNDGSRAFCAPFTVYGNVNDERPTQEDQSSGLVEDAVAVFDEISMDSRVTLRGDGSYDISIDLEELRNIRQIDCDNLALRIYDTWDCESNSRINYCEYSVGLFYDPTVSCAPYSNNELFCSGNENRLLCNDESYEYNCDSINGDRFLCSPSDLSGKYGLLNTNDNIGQLIGVDDLMIDLTQLNGKSVVLQCSDTLEIVACAGFNSNSPTKEPTEEPRDW